MYYLVNQLDNKHQITDLVSRSRLIETMEKAVAYIRVSTELQVEKNTQDNQIEAIKTYARNKDFEISKWYRDLGVSGNLTDREDLNALLDNLDNIKHVIIYDQSRLSRNFEYSMKLMFLFQKWGVKVHVASENKEMDFNDDTLQLLTTIQSWAAQQERKMIKKRQKLGIQRYIETNGSWGPKKKKINIKQFKGLRNAKVSKAAIARIFGISRATLYRRIGELQLSDN